MDHLNSQVITLSLTTQSIGHVYATPGRDVLINDQLVKDVQSLKLNCLSRNFIIRQVICLCCMSHFISSMIRKFGVIISQRSLIIKLRIQYLPKK